MYMYKFLFIFTLSLKICIFSNLFVVLKESWLEVESGIKF